MFSFWYWLTWLSELKGHLMGHCCKSAKWHMSAVFCSFDSNSNVIYANNNFIAFLTLNVLFYYRGQKAERTLGGILGTPVWAVIGHHQEI